MSLRTEWPIWTTD